jgi:ribosomal protein S18 acetylase RimI-like enzyme
MQHCDAITIRPARREDVPAIVALLADDPLGQTREEVADPLSETYWRAFDDLTRQSGNFEFVADAVGTVVGCLQLTVIPGLSRRGAKRGLIEAVRVGAAHRGAGLGDRMIRHAIEVARAEGCALVQLTTDKSRADAHRFYERLGFAATHLGMKLEL